jgi:hypothetical protein
MYYINLKNKKKYKLLSSNIINSTNSEQAQIMCLYQDEQGKKFVRERNEFFMKFQKI